MSAPVAAQPFGDRLAEATARRGTPLVLGLDPDPARLWPGTEPVGAVPGATPGEHAAAAVQEHCRRVITATAEHCVAVKLQLACFERLGPPGWETLHRVAALARANGLLVIADGKRGDIDVTAAAYAASLFDGHDTPWGHAPGLGADAITVNPYMGSDAIAPFLEGARRAGGGIFVLVRTSNPGAADFEEQQLATGEPLWRRVASHVAGLDDGKGALADAGAVCGATAPERLADLRAAMPRAPFLLPGVGAQGGTVEALSAAFEPGLGAGLVTVSRALVRAHEQSGGTPEAAAAAAADELRRACLQVAG
ncbi:MAG: orotidine-5'-phosphate decarboxylase [Solirubrobacteraceae bacterium]|nr:orotidine-5'-phosphate decarboxylase [Solirubrobacteraceae bacterium]